MRSYDSLSLRVDLTSRSCMRQWVVSVSSSHFAQVTLFRGCDCYFPPVVATPWMNVFWAKKKSTMIGRVKIVAAAMSWAKKPP